MSETEESTAVVRDWTPYEFQHETIPRMQAYLLGRTLVRLGFHWRQQMLLWASAKFVPDAEDADDNRQREQNTGLIREQEAQESKSKDRCIETLFGNLGALVPSAAVDGAKQICEQHKASFNFDAVKDLYESAIDDDTCAAEREMTGHGAQDFVQAVLGQTVLDRLEQHFTSSLSPSLLPFFRFGQALESMLSPSDFALRSRHDLFNQDFYNPESTPAEWDQNAEPDEGRLATWAIPVGGHRVDGGSTTILEQAWFSIAENHDNDAFKALFAQLDGVRNTTELSQVVTSLHQLAVNRISELTKHDARPGESYFDGQVRLDLDKGIVSREGFPDSKELKPQLVDVLKHLLAKQGGECTHDELIAEAGIKSGNATRTKQYNSPARKRLCSAISETRAICDPLGILIQSDSGVGYYVVLTTPSQSQ